MNYKIELLGTHHQRKVFQCGYEQLDRYILYQVSQDIKRRLAICFVVPNEEGEVIGYYTLSNAGIPRSQLTDQIIKALPVAYESLPATLLGRLAVRNDFKGKDIGGKLLWDALKRAYAQSRIVASMVVVVDAIDEKAARFYLKYGFIQLPDSKRLFMLMKTVEALLKV